MNKRSQGEHDRQTLSDLLERVKSGEASKALDVDIWVGLGLWTPPRSGERSAVCVDRWKRGRLNYYCPHEPVTASLDAALALVERVLPGWTVSGICQDDFKLWHAELRKGHQTSYTAVAISHETLRGSANPALALLAALLTALLAEEAGK